MGMTVGYCVGGCVGMFVDVIEGFKFGFQLALEFNAKNNNFNFITFFSQKIAWNFVTFKKKKSQTSISDFNQFFFPCDTISHHSKQKRIKLRTKNQPTTKKKRKRKQKLAQNNTALLCYFLRLSVYPCYYHWWLRN